MASTNPITPVTSGQGAELTREEWDSLIVTPLRAESAVLSIPGVHVHQSEVPLHLPIMLEGTIGDDAWVGPNEEVVELDPGTDERVLLDRGLKAAKILVRLSSKSVGQPDGLNAAQTTMSNQLVKAVDKALLQGSVAAGITGLLAGAGTNVEHCASLRRRRHDLRRSNRHVRHRRIHLRGRRQDRERRGDRRRDRRRIHHQPHDDRAVRRTRPRARPT